MYLHTHLDLHPPSPIHPGGGGKLSAHTTHPSLAGQPYFFVPYPHIPSLTLTPPHLPELLSQL